MCGIGGFWQSNSGHDLSQISKYFKDGLIHRGPDSQGDWISQENNLLLTHSRLSILDLSDLASQPMHSISGNVVITFNGEIYNYSEIRTDLQKLNKYNWITDHSDTEVIIHAFEEWGIECVNKFRGIFAFGLWDNLEKTLYVVRDRFGVKPVYYVSKAGYFGFSSELKPFFNLFQEKKLNSNGVIEYLTSRGSIAPNSMVEGMNKLEQGHYLKVKLNRSSAGIEIAKVKYYDLEKQVLLHPVSQTNKAEIIRELETQLKSSIKYQWISDTPVCLFLSGGIDSSLIAAISSELFDKRIHAFTIGLPGHDCDETKYARYVADRFNIELNILDFSSNPLEQLNHWLYYNDDLLSDPAAFALFFLSKEINDKGYKVVLSGEGSDEIFGGYSVYLNYFTKKHDNKQRRLLESLLKSVYGFYPKRGLESYYTGNFANDVYYGAAQMQTILSIENLIKNKTILEDYLKWNQEYRDDHKQNNPLDYMLLYDLNYRIPNDLLMRTDRATMAWAVEARVPFLDHLLVEYSMTIPAKYKIDHERKLPKSILKELALKYFDEDFVYRPKMGFPIPVNQWLLDRRVLSEMQEFISEKRIGCLNYEYISKILAQHRTKKSDYGDRLFSLYLLEKYVRLWNIS